MNSLKKSMISSTRNQFSKSPILKLERRKSSIPLNLKKFISYDNLVGLSQEKISNKNSHKESYSIRKHQFSKINTSIPEESESFSNCEEIKNRKESNHNEYYINYINNLYEKETHLNKEILIKTPSSKKTNLKKYDDPKIKFKRRNSASIDHLLNLNFHKKFCVEKGQKIPTPSKMKSAKLNNLLKKKKLSDNDDVLKINNNISKSKDKSKSKSKNKSKSKVSSKDKSKDKSKNNDKKSKNNSNSKKNVKEIKMKIKETDSKTETKTETINSCKIKNKTIKSLLCCLVNENNLSTEND